MRELVFAEKQKEGRYFWRPGSEGGRIYCILMNNIRYRMLLVVTWFRCLTYFCFLSTIRCVRVEVMECNLYFV